MRCTTRASWSASAVSLIATRCWDERARRRRSGSWRRVGLGDSFDLESVPYALTAGETCVSSTVALGAEHRLYVAATAESPVALQFDVSDGDAWLPLATLH